MNINLNAIIAELKVNQRLRLGLWAILGILWLYGLLELRDDVQHKGEAHSALSKKTAKLKSMVTQSEWHSRQAEALSLQLKLEPRLWRESSIGLAQATFNDWLNQLTQQSSLSKVLLVVAAKEDESGAEKSQSEAGNGARTETSSSNLWKVSAKLAFDFNPRTFYPFLTRITMNEKKIAVESLTIRSTPTPKADLQLVVYYVKSTPGGPGEIESAKAK